MAPDALTNWGQKKWEYLVYIATDTTPDTRKPYQNRLQKIFLPSIKKAILFVWLIFKGIL